MRVALIALLCLVAAFVACGKSSGEGQSGSATARTNDELKREQQQFDAMRRPEKVVEALNIKPGSHVADIGASSGLLTVHLARAVRPGGKVVATDIDSRVLDFLQTRVQAEGVADVVETKVVEEDAPGLPPNAFDAILMAEVDHLLKSPAAWLREATKSLKPGGRIVISNRIHHLAESKQHAAEAGLKLLGDATTPVPTHFIAVFTVGDAK